MKKKWFKIMLISIIVLLIGGSIVIMYLVNNQCMENGKKAIFGTWGKRCSPVVDIKDDGKDYSKNVDNMEIKWHIPSSWNYEEVETTNNILFSLKLFFLLLLTNKILSFVLLRIESLILQCNYH